MRPSRRIVVLSTLALAVPWFAANAQDAGKTRRIGYVVYGTIGQRMHLEQSFIDGMRDQGYVEGKNLVIERIYAETNSGRLRDGAKALAALKLDAIVTTCSPSTKAVKEATAGSGTPILMAVVPDPIGQGLVQSLARPGGNISGRASQGEDTLSKMLEFLTTALPNSDRIAVLYNTMNAVHPKYWPALQHVTKPRGIELVRFDIASASDFPAAFEKMERERFRALLVLGDDPTSFTARAQVAALAQKFRIPAIYSVSEFVEQGGLMSYGENYRSSVRSTASHVGKVLAGARPADLPVEQPTTFEFVVNLKTAKALGLSIPAEILLRADRVIE